MVKCHYCGKILGTYGSELKYTIEATTFSSVEKYFFDTKSCMVSWVRETYGTESS